MDITNRSSEHIIHQALGGLLESEEICCIKCNSQFGTSLDAKFVDFFAPITENLNLKTSRNKSESKYWGSAVDKDVMRYRVQMKGNKIRNVFDLTGKHVNRFINIKELVPTQFEFNANNNDFLRGFKKIAFNFALSCGIHPSELDLIFDWEKREFLNEKKGIVPFIPMNYLDDQLELRTINDLTHSLILFNIDNLLCAYIDLFNTFQYYVLLSEKYEGDLVNENYCQRLIKHDFDEEAIKRSVKVWDYKDAEILSSQYRIPFNKPKAGENDGNETIEELFSRIEKKALEAIRKKSYTIDYRDWIYNKLCSCELTKTMFIKDNMEESNKRYKAFSFYVQDENINLNRFRILMLDSHNNDKVKSYIELINDRIRLLGPEEVVMPYFEAKIEKLNEFLIQQRQTSHSI